MVKDLGHLSDLSNHATIVEILRWRGHYQPDRDAYIFLDDKAAQAHLTYDQLDRQARAIGAQLQSLGLSGERTLLLYPPGLEFIAALLGCLYAGVVAVPAYPPRPNRPMPRLQAIVADAQAGSVLTTATILSNVERRFEAMPDLASLHWLASDDIPVNGGANWRAPIITGDTLALLQYTSGSTSSPKGVMISHSNVMHNLTLMRHGFQIDHSSRGVFWLPGYHDMGLIGAILEPLYLGSAPILMSPASFFQRPVCWLEAMTRFKATIGGGPNFAYDLCVDKITPEQRATLDLSNWQLAFCGAEPVHFETLERFANTFAACGFRREAFYPCYGLAEGTLFVSGGVGPAQPKLQTVQETGLAQNRIIEAAAGEANAKTLVGCGQALLDQKIIIVHPETMAQCPPDQVGEIWVSGPSVAQGYWNRPEETERVFRAYLADTGEGPFLRTGDLGFLHGGELFMTGRLKDLIIIRGRNYYPQDIELTVEQSHPALRPGCGAAFAVEVGGEERLVVTQEIKRTYRRTLDVDQIIGAIRKAVAAQHEIQVYAVWLLKTGQIPKTSSGKIQRHACRAGFMANSLEVVGAGVLGHIDHVTEPETGAPDESGLSAEAQPRLRLEGELRNGIARILGLAPAQLDLEQPFNTLGLDSLRAVEIKNYIEANFNLELPLETLLEEISITRLAAWIRAGVTGQAPASTAGATLSETRPRSESAGLIHSSAAAKEIRFSLFYFSSNEAEFTGDKYRLLIEGAKFADQHGFAAVWIPERHFHVFGGLYPNPSVLGAALAMVTERVRLRAGSVVLPLHNPIRVAEEWSVVDNLSGGRVDLAFARGWNPNDFVLSPATYANRTEFMISSIRAVQKLWQGKSITLPNGLGRQTEVKLYPLPQQRELPVWLTCSEDKDRFIQAGALGYNVLTALLFQSVEELAEKIALYRASRAEHGHDPETGQVTLMAHTFVAEAMSLVRSKVQGPFMDYLKSSVNLWRQGSKRLDDLSAPEQEAMLSYAFERYFQTSTLFGTPESCLETVTRLKDIGVDEIACLIDFGIEVDTVMAGLYALKKLKELSNRAGPGDEAPGTGSTVSDHYDHLAEIHELNHVDDLYLTFGIFPQRVPGFSWLLTFNHPQTYQAHAQLARQAQSQLRNLLFAEIDFSAIHKVLDFGCGYGSDLITLGQKHPWLQLHGYTISAKQAELGRQKIEANDLQDRVAIFHRDSATDPFPEQYDLVFGFEVAVYVKRKQALFLNISNALHEGGILLLADFMSRTVSGIDHPPTSSYIVTTEAWVTLLAEHKLRVVRCIDASQEVANFLDDPHFSQNQTEPGDLLRNEVIKTHFEAWHNLGHLLRRKLAAYILFTVRKDSSLSTADIVEINKKRLNTPIPYSDLNASSATGGSGSRQTMTETAPATGAGDDANRIEPHEPQSIFPLSPGQQALWFLYKIAPKSWAYNALLTARLHSQLDIPALRRALQALVARHPVLHTTYAEQAGQPVQRIHPDQPVYFEQIDASGRNRDELRRQVTEKAQLPFDLERGPVMRVSLFSRSTTDHILLLALHHIACDGWSLWILIDDLRALYAAERAGAPAVLEPLALSYADYVRQQANLVATPAGERLWAYWQKQLSGELPALNLPADYPRPPAQSFYGASHSFKLSSDLTQKLKALAQAAGATLYMTLLAAFQVLLYRYTGQTDLLVGSPTFGSSRREFSRVVGYFVNPVVLRANFADNPEFKTFLRQVRQTVTGAIAHQDYPFPLLVERLRPNRDPSRSPLFQVWFVLQMPYQAGVRDGLSGLNEGANRGEADGLKLEPYDMAQQEGQFDLALEMVAEPEWLTGVFKYDAHLFDAATIERMAGHFQSVLEAVIAQPEERVSNLPLLRAGERYQLLEAWNDTRVEYDLNISLHQLIEAQVDRTPDAAAVLFEAEQLSYGELNRRANQLAHHLRSLGVGPETLVGIFMERSLEMVIGLLAVLKAGGAYVPLDPAYPEERLAFMMADAQAPVLLTQARLKARLPATEARLICLDTEWEAIERERDDNPTGRIKPENLAYVIYTSGSTGRPKGAMNTHRGICNRLLWMQETYQLTAVDRVLQKTPFSFDVSVWEFFWPLLAGARLVVAKPGGHQDSTYLVNLIAARQITTVHFVPSMLHVFLEEGGLEACRCLQRVICSGEALPFELQERFFARLEAELHNLYGPTEAAIDVTFWRCERKSRRQFVPIGRPIANTRIYILDPDLQPVPIGAPGELHIGGVGLARGYLGRPALTAEKFIPNPFPPSIPPLGGDERGGRLYKTGDLARYGPDGNIEYLGRLDDQVKVRGFRIELGEIAAVLAQHPAVQATVVVARDKGSPAPAIDKRLVAYFVSGRKPEPTVSELRHYLKQKLPDYMVPSAFVSLSALPLTPNGKIDRQALPAPGPVRPELASSYVAPRDSIEEKLAEIWARVLGIDRVGVHDNFFDLGGASIQSLRVAAQARAAALPITPELLFEYQTIAELAAASQRISPASSAQANQVSFQTEGQANAGAITGPEVQQQRWPGNTVIESLGVYLPPKTVSTEAVLQGCHREIEFPLAQMTGIKSRRMAGEAEFSIDLARKAVADCLARSNYRPEDIELLICCNISRYDGPNHRVSFEPNTSVKLKKQFGFDKALVFDVTNACAGMFTAIDIVDAFLKAGVIRCGMVVSGEYISHLTQTAQKELEGYMDSRLACLTLGDAGAALILESGSTDQVGFHDLEMYTLGRYSSLCVAKVTDQAHGGAIMFTDAIRIPAIAIPHVVRHAAHMLNRHKWSPDSVQHLLMHQTSETTLRGAVQEINTFFKTQVSLDGSVINNLAERGNTATTSHFVAVWDNIVNGRIKTGDRIVFGISGSGQTVGTALYTFDDLPDRLRASSAPRTAHTQTGQSRRAAARPHRPRVRIESIGVIPPDRPVERDTVKLVKLAAEDCLEKSSYSRDDINLLIHAGVYRNDFLSEPAIAALAAGELRLNDDIAPAAPKKTFAFDLFNGALGFLEACYVASQMIRAGKHSTAMVVASEVENNAGLFPQKLLGLKETGSAVILDEAPDHQTGLGNFVFKCYTDHIDAFESYTGYNNGRLYLHFVTAQPSPELAAGDTGFDKLSPPSPRESEQLLHFDQKPPLEDYFLACIPEAVAELLKLEGLDISQINVIIPPQISATFLSKLSLNMAINQDRFVDIAPEGADYFTSSLVYAWQRLQAQNWVKRGDIGLIISVGAGLQVGCATYYF